MERVSVTYKTLRCVWLYLFLAILVSRPGWSQTDKDYQNLKSDTLSVRFEGAYRLALAYRRTQQDSAAFYALQAATYLPQLDSLQRIQAFTVQGLVAYEAGKYQEAIAFYEAAAKEAARQNNVHEQAWSICRKGNAYTMLGQATEAVQNYQQAIQLAEQNELNRDRVYFLQSLAYCYQKTGSPDKAIPYFEDALAYFEANQNWKGVISTHNLLHIAWSNLDSLEQALNILKQNFEAPLGAYLSPKDSATMLHNLGRLYNMMEQYQAAQAPLNTAMTIKQRQNNPESALKSFIELITSLKALGELQEALNLVQTIDTNTLNKSSIYTQRDYYRHLSEIMASKGIYETAYRYQLKFDSLDQVIFNQENQESVTQLELQLTQQENQRLDLERQTAHKERNLILVIGLLVSLILGLFLVFRRREFIKKQAYAKEQLMEQERLVKARTNFFNQVSHELRTPLTLIQAPAQSLMEQIKDPQQTELLNTIVRSTEEMNALVEQTLDLERAQSLAIKLDKQAVEIDTFFRELAKPFQLLAKKKEIQFSYLNELDATWLQLDPKRTKHIVRNLLTNAFKFTPAGHSVVLCLKKQGDYLAIQVKDTGPGIPKKDIAKLFDHFYRVEDSVTAQITGTGIGLHLAKQLALVQQGDLSVESELGSGSTFTCTLPWLIPAVAPSIKPTQEQPPLPEQTATLLVVEDHPEMRAYISQLLSTQYNVLEAEHGIQALEIMQHQSPDLILSDVMMPEMDGFAFLEVLQQDDRLSAIPFILLTALSEPQTKLKALTAGVSDYINKPFHPEELQAQVKHLLQFRKDRMTEEQAAKVELSHGQQWLKEVETIMIEQMANKQFSIAMLAQLLHISERQLFRKVKNLAGLTPNRYFREVRLKEARRLLMSRQFSTIAEVSFAVGFDTPEYFSKIFKERFGKSPKESLLVD